jgi:hypothetical protein
MDHVGAGRDRSRQFSEADRVVIAREPFQRIAFVMDNILFIDISPF